MKLIVEVVVMILELITLILPLLISVAFLTLVERKVMGAMQKRKGPNVVGFMGVLQPIADAVKLIVKETILPSVANRIIFVVAPILMFVLSLVGWSVIPFSETSVLADINLGILFIFAVSSLGVYGVIMSGWSSNSRYAFLGALRSTAQMISYEISIGLILICVIICVGSLNLVEIVMFQRYIWFIVPLFPLFIMFYVSALAETNRSPFDLPEAEGELVAGYNVEYSSVGFALFFLAEYANIILMCALGVVLFLGGWLLIGSYGSVLWFVLKLNVLLFGFVWVRATLPRYRYDQLMYLGWKVLLPLSLGLIFLISGIIIV